jgi:hypothetical protein
MQNKILTLIFGLLCAVTMPSFVSGQSIPTISPLQYYNGSTKNVRMATSSSKLLIGALATTTTSSLETPSLTITGLLNKTCIGTDSTGVVIVGTCGSGGGGGGSIGTSTVPSIGNLAYWTSASALGSIATGTLTESVSGLSFDATRGIVGGSAVLSLDSGFIVPTSTRLVDHDTAFGWGNHAIQGYLTGNQSITLSGDASGSGSTGITVIVANDSHDHTGSTLSGIDISDDTNLSADGTEIVLTGDALSLGNTLTFTSASSSYSSTTGATIGNANINQLTFGGVSGTAWSAYCTSITGDAGLCDGNDATGGGGGGASDWSQSVVPGVLSPTTTIGIRVNASSTFLGALTVSSTTPDYKNPIFEVSTSSDNSGDLFSVEATSSLMNHTSSVPNFLQESGARISIGAHSYMGYEGVLDQFALHGRMRNPDWFIADCPITSGAVAITSDTAAATGFSLCNSMDFYEDTTATLTTVSGSGYSYGQLGSAAANDGAGVFLRGLTGGFLVPATSTPSMEVTARIGTIVANSTTTNYIIGFSNLAVAGNTYETLPTSGCHFVASSTQANWRAICRTSASVVTNVDTGVSSTTNGVAAGGGGKFRTFRIDMDADNAVFYIANGNVPGLQKVADISTTYPGTVTLNAGIHFGRTTGTQAVQFDFFGLNTQWRRFTPNR